MTSKMRFWVSCLLSLVAMAATAQDTVDAVRPVLSMFTLDAGSASLLDTYLSPITYHGSNFRLGYEHFQATGFRPLTWTRQLEAGIDYNYVKNPAGNHDRHALMGEFRWAMMHRWQPVLTERLQLMAGPMTQFRGGIIYAPINSNNVVSVKLHWAVGLQLMTVYNTSLLGRQLSVRYQASLPVVGAFFSPDYDEAYYEIYLGNHEGLAHVGWWGNRFDLANYVTADWRLGGTILRLGYRGRIETSWVNRINTHIFTHSLVLGIGGEFLSLSPSKRLSRQARIVSSQY